MSLHTIQSLINRAKVYVDDDHNDEGGWIADNIWLQFAVSEIIEQHKRWLRNGSVSVSPIQVSYASNSSDTLGYYREIEDVSAVIGVAYDDGSSVRFLDYAGQMVWVSETAPAGDAFRWWMTQVGDTVQVRLDPRPDTDLTNYKIRYVPILDAAIFTDATIEVQIPSGMDERLVLGIAKRAHVKDSGASAAIEKLIFQADAELAFNAAGRAGGLKAKMRPTRCYSRQSTPRVAGWPDRGSWVYV